MRKTNRGITLIALVITIIVMMILVAVTVSMAINGGLFEYAGKAVGETQNAIDKEAALSGGQITIDNVVYNSVDEYLNKDKGLDWTAILADANANPAKYKHPDQSSTNGDIGIGTDGKPVNMDLWPCELNFDKNGIILSEEIGSAVFIGYSNANIDETTGKIQGEVPQYIKLASDDDFYPVTSMAGTFYNCTNLKQAPKIPNTVEIMDYIFYGCTSLTQAPTLPQNVTHLYQTFYNCTNLKQAPVIPSSVTYMGATFSWCTNLTGTLTINANPTSYGSCLRGAATAEGTSLTVIGTSTLLNEIKATASENSNIQ